LQSQLEFWRRMAIIFGSALAFAAVVILVGLGALLSVASTSGSASNDAKIAAQAAQDSSESNHKVLAIIQEQTGPAAQDRQATVLKTFQHTLDCNVRMAAAELVKPFGPPPAGYLDGCSATPTTTTTEAP
jgi:hypothetical protein